MPPIEMISMASIGLVIVFGGQRVIDGDLQVGVLFAFVVFLLRFFEPIRLMTIEFTQLQKAMASGARIFELLDIEPDLSDRQDAQTMPTIHGRVEFRDVTFGYVPGIPVLRAHQPRHRAGGIGGVRRSDRSGQDVDYLAGPALLRRHGGTGARGRPWTCGT